jgi:hypothetical protein
MVMTWTDEDEEKAGQFAVDNCLHPDCQGALVPRPRTATTWCCLNLKAAQRGAIERERALVEAKLQTAFDSGVDFGKSLSQDFPVMCLGGKHSIGGQVHAPCPVLEERQKRIADAIEAFAEEVARGAPRNGGQGVSPGGRFAAANPGQRGALEEYVTILRAALEGK